MFQREKKKKKKKITKIYKRFPPRTEVRQASFPRNQYLVSLGQIS